MKQTLIVLISLQLLLAKAASAEITLPALISNGMVLQQKSDVALWGKAKPNTTVTIVTFWNKKSYRLKSDDQGNWRVKVSTPAAGGPYSISFSDGKELRLTDILIGEVWICSGQSNMEMPVKGFKNQPVQNAADILLDADNSAIRLFAVEKVTTGTPQTDCKGYWAAASAASVKEFSAVGYLYAKILQKNLRVPVGVIQTAWGGTIIEAWMSKQTLASFPEVVIPPSDSMKNGNKNNPTGIFNGMVQPLIGYGIRGVIWYQGEQNRTNPALYARLMPAMVQEWRTRWGIGDWPFYYVQIAPYGYVNDKEQVVRVPWLREVQLEAMKTIPNSGMAVTMDIGNKTIIHPADKETVSKRLACWALAKTYGMEGLPYRGPEYKAHTVSGNKITVTFTQAENGLTSFYKPLTAFEIAGADKKFYPATAQVTGNGIVVTSDSVQVPVAVRYGYKAWVIGDLYNNEGFPASPFRTDSWEIKP